MKKQNPVHSKEIVLKWGQRCPTAGRRPTEGRDTGKERLGKGGSSDRAVSPR